MSSAADTAAWRDLLPWATPEERRELLDSEHLAALYFGELARRGLGGLHHVEAFERPEALEAFAVVLAAHHGHPTRLMDAEPLLPRSKRRGDRLLIGRRRCESRQRAISENKRFGRDSCPRMRPRTTPG